MKIQVRIDALSKRLGILELGMQASRQPRMRREMRVHYNDLLARRTRLINEREMSHEH